jgi:hypothetical protein
MPSRNQIPIRSLLQFDTGYSDPEYDLRVIEDEELEEARGEGLSQKMHKETLPQEVQGVVLKETWLTKSTTHGDQPDIHPLASASRPRAPLTCWSPIRVIAASSTCAVPQSFAKMIGFLPRVENVCARAQDRPSRSGLPETPSSSGIGQNCSRVFALISCCSFVLSTPSHHGFLRTVCN